MGYAPVQPYAISPQQQNPMLGKTATTMSDYSPFNSGFFSMLPLELQQQIAQHMQQYQQTGQPQTMQPQNPAAPQPQYLGGPRGYMQQVAAEDPRMQAMRAIQQGGGGPEFMRGQYTKEQ